MVIATYHVDEVVGVVSRDGKVLARDNHLGSVGNFAFVIDHEAAIGGKRGLALQTTHQ